MADIDPLANLLPSLIQCFSVIFIGYLAAKLSLITSQSSAIGTYVTKFALPALFFRSMATIDFNDVNWLFIVAVSLGKLILFATTIMCTMLVTVPTNYGMAGILSMFITQSNDVALGYPILLSLYPDLAKYIYLFAPAQLVFINPLCFVLLEWHEYRSTALSIDAVNISAKRRFLVVFKNVTSNPLVFMTVIGVIFNFILNHTLPLVLDKILQILADSFSGVALFYLGMNMVGKMGSVTKKGVYVLVLILLGKLIFLPFLTRELVVHLVDIHSPSNQSMNYSLVAFLYGGLPTAPPVFLIANNFQVLPDLIATALVLGTFLSGPLMFITSRAITMVVASRSQFDSILKSTAFSVSVISLFGCVWVLIVFLLSRRCRSAIHKMTICYTFFVILTCSGMVMGRIIFLPNSSNQTHQTAGWKHYFQFSIFFIGCVGTRLWTVIIAASLMIIKRNNVQFLFKSQIYFYILGSCVPISITAVLLLSSSKQSVADIDPSFQYGRAQIITSVVVLTTSITLTITFLIIQARSGEYNEINGNYSPRKLIECDDTSINDNRGDNPMKGESQMTSRRNVEENRSSDALSQEIQSVNRDVLKDDEEFQTHRHLMLTIILVVTMGFGMFLCLWRLINEEVSGIYIELEFLDCVFNFGQGFIIWAIFGLDMELIVIPFRKKITTVWRSIHEFYVLPGSSLSSDVIRIKKQFNKYHLKSCRRDIVTNIRHDFKFYTDVFTGKSLIDWIVRIGLANNREDATGYGQALVTGRVIEHVKKMKELLDNDDNLYRFSDSCDGAVDLMMDESVQSVRE